MSSSRPNTVPTLLAVPRTPTKMFADRKGSFTSNRLSTNFPSAVSHSMKSSFSSDSSCESALLATPVSTPRQSYASVKLEDGSFLHPTPSCTPERFGNGMGYCPLPSLNDDGLSAFQDPNMLFSVDGGKNLHDQNMLPFYHFPTGHESIYEQFNNQHELSAVTPALDLDLYSPTSGIGSSPVSMDFVVPAQTTFNENFDMSSPMRQPKPLNFEMGYESPAPDFIADFSLANSPTGSTKYYSSSYADSQSATTTPSRPSTLRHLVFEPINTSTALQRIQEDRKPDHTTRPLRRRTKKENTKRPSARFLPPNIRVQKLADKECPWAGCDRKFQRQEHLKRHERIHLNMELIPCEFCQKKFGRSDNLKSHIKLHADPMKKSRRTKFFEGAQRVVDEMTRKQRKAEMDTAASSPSSGLSFARGRVSGY